MDPVNIIAIAKTKFPEEVATTIEESGIAEYDLSKLTRDDVDREFKSFKFPVRARIFEFLKGFETAEQSSEESFSEASWGMLDSSASSCDTEPIASDGQDIACSSSSIAENSTKGQFSKFKIPPARPIPIDKQLEEYPGGLKDPFPISEVYKTFLKSPRKLLLANRPILLHVVRDVYSTLQFSLDRKPSRDELSATAKRFCQEYPVLQCGNRECYNAFFEMLKKRAKNAEYNQKIKIKSVNQKIIEKPPMLTDWQAREIVKDIHKMSGKGIAQAVMKKYPILKDHQQCVFAFATMLQKDIVNTVKAAEEKWDFIVKEQHIPDEVAPFTALKQVLETLAGNDGISCIVQYGTTYVPRADIAQPFLLMPAENSPKNVSIVVDELPFITVPTVDSHKSVVQVLLVFLATFYILNLQYPAKARKAYKRLEKIMD